jgi:AcrR family transcriptional regulator
MNDLGRTKDRLITHARKLFASNGFSGVGVREITRAAQANLGAVTYHFGSKQALYDAVLVSVGDDLAGRFEAAAATTGTTAERLTTLVASLFAFFREAPEAPLLILREITTAGVPPATIVPLIRRNLQAVDRVLCDGRARGEVGAVEPMMVAFTIISQSVWFALVGRFLPELGAIPLGDATFAARVEAHVAEVVRRSILPEADTT